MHTLVVFAHPWHGSFNKAILDKVEEGLIKSGRPHTVIDLNKEGFNPVMEEADLALFAKGKTTDPDVERYQKLLGESDELVLIFPVWWFAPPAILKGWFDKVFLPGFGYDQPNHRLLGRLKNVKRTTVISTSESPAYFMWFAYGSPIRNVVTRGTLGSVGLRNVKWLNSNWTTSGAPWRHKRFLNKVEKRFERKG